MAGMSTVHFDIYLRVNSFLLSVIAENGMSNRWKTRKKRKNDVFVAGTVTILTNNVTQADFASSSRGSCISRIKSVMVEFGCWSKSANKELSTNKLSNYGAGLVAIGKTTACSDTLCIASDGNEAGGDQDQPECAAYCLTVPKFLRK